MLLTGIPQDSNKLVFFKNALIKTETESNDIESYEKLEW